MASIVCEPCRNNKCTKCVGVCPVECFHEDQDMLVIDPDVCIDCGACHAECPVRAIFFDDEVPEQWRDYIRLNAEKSKTLPLITEMK